MLGRNLNSIKQVHWPSGNNPPLSAIRSEAPRLDFLAPQAWASLRA